MLSATAGSRLRTGNHSEHAGRLQVIIPYTTPKLTRAALAAAAGMARGLHIETILLAVHIVPYPLPLHYPDVPLARLREQLEAFVSASGMSCGVRLVLARDREQALRQMLRGRALVVVATRKRWWRTREERMARGLSRAGHGVALVKV